MKTERLNRSVAAATVGLAVTAGLVGASVTSAQAYDTSTGKISCKAVNVRKVASKKATIVGVAYKNDRITYDLWVYKKSEKTWYTRVKVTRKSDGAKIAGYVLYQCANPYGTDGAPTPPIPK